MKIAIILKAPCFTERVQEERVIYADAAYRYADKIGDKNVLAVVGDFDSLGSAPKNQTVVQLNKEKNYTDGECAVRLAKQLGGTEIVIYGAYGGKMEHVLGNLALLKIAKTIGLTASIIDNGITTVLLDKSRKLKVVAGSSVSIIPYGGECAFNKSEGLYYPLDDLILTPCDTRGISNVAEKEEILIDIKSGEALVFFEKNKNG